MRWRFAPTRRDRGQATVELALCLPVVVVLAMGLLQVTLIVRDQLAVDLAAREGARRAAVAADPRSAALTGVRDSLGGRTGETASEVEVIVLDHTVRVTVHIAPTAVPVIGSIVSGRRLTGSVTMLLEPMSLESMLLEPVLLEPVLLDPMPP